MTVSPTARPQPSTGARTPPPRPLLHSKCRLAAGVHVHYNWRRGVAVRSLLCRACCLL